MIPIQRQSERFPEGPLKRVEREARALPREEELRDMLGPRRLRAGAFESVDADKARRNMEFGLGYDRNQRDKYLDPDYDERNDPYLFDPDDEP